MKYIVFSIIIAFFSFFASACEICGCGTGNYYIGLLPQFRSSFLGVRYQFSSFHTTIKNDPGQYSKDLFQTVEVWGGINISKRWQLLAIVPYNFIHQASDDGTYNSSGIGDIATLGNYEIFNHSSSTSGKKLITQQVWIGAGIKFATGKFDIDPGDPALIALANTQVGTGSTDFILNVMYNVNIDRFGVSTGARYKINTSGNNQYIFGNKFTASSIAFYYFTKSKTTITPNAGLFFEQIEASKLLNQKVAETGGFLLSAAPGVEVNISNITIGCNAQLPLTQNFANEQTNTKLKGMFHITISF